MREVESHMSQLRKNPVGKALAFGAVLLLLVVGQSLATDDKQDKTVKGRIEILEAQVADLQELLEHFTRDGDDIYIEGANLHVVNGEGSTSDTNGVGNVIIGYNEPRGANWDIRTGSHMLVVGSQNNYSGCGGIVVGILNETNGEYASVSGGAGNTATGDYASVSGGAGNTATGDYASVSGGANNTATGDLGSVSGGLDNTVTAYAYCASVSGGAFNTASGIYDSVSGGMSNTAYGWGASVSGGSDNTASGTRASVSGGRNRSATGMYNWVAGGLFQAN